MNDWQCFREIEKFQLISRRVSFLGKERKRETMRERGRDREHSDWKLFFTDDKTSDLFINKYWDHELDTYAHERKFDDFNGAILLRTIVYWHRTEIDKPSYKSSTFIRRG